MVGAGAVGGYGAFRNLFGINCMRSLNGGPLAALPCSHCAMYPLRQSIMCAMAEFVVKHAQEARKGASRQSS